LTNGCEIYPHRQDLESLPFWKCDGCKNHVGCHHKTSSPTRPLGVIATKEIKGARRHIHTLIDPIWKSKRMTRGKLYREIARRLGVAEYHTGELKSMDEARRVYKIGIEIKESLKK